MSEIIMIRHGQASFGGETYDRLSETGRRQMEATASFFINADYRFDHVFSGTLKRQKESAESFIETFKKSGVMLLYAPCIEGLNEHRSEDIMKGILPLVIKDDPSLAEDASKLLKDRAAFQRVYERVMYRWVSGVDNIPGLQTWEEFKSGVRSAIDEIRNGAGKGSTSAVFTSGGVIASSVQAALHLHDENAIKLSWQIANASLTRFKFSNRGFALSSFNSFGHLERGEDNLLTYR
jgi:broad specificity phosphatase PhoE